MFIVTQQQRKMRTQEQESPQSYSEGGKTHVVVQDRMHFDHQGHGKVQGNVQLEAEEEDGI